MALAVPSGAPQLNSTPGITARHAGPAVSVVVVNFCQWRNTARLTRQLRRCDAVRARSAEVVVVDNNSGPHPLASRLRKLRGVRLRRFGRNYGFAKAVNRAARAARGEWLLLLNPDVTVEEGFLDEVLVAAARAEPDVGVIGFALRNPDGSRQASAGPYPTLARTLGGLLRPRARRKCRHVSSEACSAVAWVTGGCFLVRRSCFDQLNGLDDRYFLYYEDVDFCRRARAAGWSVWYEPKLGAVHHSPLHARSVPPPLRLITRHALLTYAHRHWPAWQSRLLGSIIWAEACIRERLAPPADRDGYRELRAVVGDVLAGRAALARKRVRFAARFLDRISAAQDRRTS